MVDIAFYLVSESIARRSGVMQSRYRTQDGRFILDTKDLSNIRLTSDEFITGLEGVEKIEKNDAMLLIKQNNYTMGLPVDQTPVAEESTEEPIIDNDGEDATGGDAQEQENTDSEQPTTENESEEETITGEDVGDVEDVVGDTTDTTDDGEEDTESEPTNEEEEQTNEENNNEEE